MFSHLFSRKSGFLTRFVATSGLIAGLMMSPFAHAQNETRLDDTSRLVTIGGSITEIVYALGSGSELVGRDTTSTFPPEANALPDIGYMRQLSPEGILSVNPSAIISIEGAGPPETLDVLGKANVDLAIIPESYDRDGILKKVTTVGALLGKDQEAATLAEKIAAKLDPILEENEKRPADARKSAIFILSLRGGKVMASGTGTAANGVIKAAGLTNAIGDFPGYKTLSDEAVITAAPDVILMMDGAAGNHVPKDEDVWGQPALTLTPAGASHSLYRIDPVGMMNFGPRFADHLKALTEQIYGK
ncbi:heme/hemin ABC transporter substrate-binding protein [Martelella mediterranea]|uniref:Iron complex transport system substrate-binding protein n=1 Tax=Martelella mediterranea TaxID=293089 RepID=A0A4R3NPS1_9HYPH|nr:ABC transporter substrate-binding protein [Martelella mediterranea]TCT37876.1 iron complex transport system substrate-binding protein [Martelella mediterranea]